MADCGPDHGNGCTYSSMDMGAHEVCVTKLPHGFSSETGQGPWSDDFTGQPWCICIWAYSNYILQNKDLPLRCESIPATVLEEQYSLDKFKQCGSMSSTDGCGAEDIRRSIQSLCQQCDEQAGSDQGAKDALQAKCDSILASAPAAAMQRLYEASSKTSGISRHLNAGRSSLFALGMLAFASAGTLVALVIRTSSRRNTISQQDAENQQTSQRVSAEESNMEPLASLLAQSEPVEA